jgi:hypothetical protein
LSLPEDQLSPLSGLGERIAEREKEQGKKQKKNKKK